MRPARLERRSTRASRPPLDLHAQRAALERDGFASLSDVLDVRRRRELREDFERLFAEALATAGGAVNRGPRRYYFAVPPERVRCFLDLVTEPRLVELSRAVLGPSWEVVEVGFDVPRPGAAYQPWHRDFPTPPKCAAEHVYTSLAFNVTTVDVTPEMGPFELAPGTQWDEGDHWKAQMFPPEDEVHRYEALRRAMLARLGDVSVRSGLAVHRGTPNRSDVDRGVLILGVVSPDDPTPEHHRLVMTRAYDARLPDELREHLRTTLVDELPDHVEQAHEIEGLIEGADPYA